MLWDESQSASQSYYVLNRRHRQAEGLRVSGFALCFQSEHCFVVDACSVIACEQRPSEGPKGCDFLCQFLCQLEGRHRGSEGAVHGEWIGYYSWARPHVS